MIFHFFSILTWKYFHFRKYYWFLTICEIVIPLLVAIGVPWILSFHYQSLLDGKIYSNYPSVIYPAVSAENLITDARRELLCVLYTPSTKFTEAIMRKVRSKFPKKRIMFAETESHLEKIMSNRTMCKTPSIGIVFWNTEEDNQIPNNFDYELRLLSKSRIDGIYDNNLEIEEPIGNTTTNEYVTFHFTGMQLILDSAFINLKFNKKTTAIDKGFFQSFPKPELVYNPNGMGILFVIPAVILASLIQSFSLMAAIIEEKSNGLKKLLEVCGINEWLLWTSWFFLSFAVSFTTFSIVIAVLYQDFNGSHTACLQAVTPFVMWCFISLYVIAILAFCFFFCAIFNRISYAGLIFSTVLIFGSCIGYFSDEPSIMFLSCFIPSGALIVGGKRIVFYELFSVKLSWSSLSNAEVLLPFYSMTFVFIMLLIDILLYFWLAYYLSRVRPGKFGIPKPLFLFTKCFARKYQNVDKYEEEPETEYIQSVTETLKPKIVIKDLRKNFEGTHAVDGLNVQFYENEITTILGHNGAGKSTTIAILTGLLKPTSGSILYDGNIDFFKQKNVISKKLGVCFQEDRLFSYLSVKKHMLFFGMLRGLKSKEANQEAEEYLKIIGLQRKRNSSIGKITDGMKRSLSLMIALMGKTEVLILDETNIRLRCTIKKKNMGCVFGITKIRGSQTVLLSTQNMDEAEVLSDRIAILDNGKLKCYGTTSYLREKFGFGYELTVTGTGKDGTAINNYILSLIPNSLILSENENRTVYKLPLSEANSFPRAFHYLELNKEKLKIQQLKIICTTMEDIFLKVANIINSNSAKEMDQPIKIQIPKLTNEKKYGFELKIQQFRNLLHKKYLYTRRNLRSVFLQIILPSLIAMLVIWVLTIKKKVKVALKLSLELYPETSILLKKKNNSLGDLLPQFVSENDCKIFELNTDDVVTGLLSYGKQNIFSYRGDLILAAEFNDTTNILLFNPLANHGIGVAVNLLSNLVIRQITGNSSVFISTSNHPIQNNQVFENPLLDNMMLWQTLWWITLAYFSIDLLDYFNTPLRKERSQGFYQIQLLSRVSLFVYWISTLVFDSVFFLIIIIIRVLIFLPLDSANFLDFGYTMKTVFIVFLAFIPGSLLFSYSFNTFIMVHEGNTAMSFISNILGNILVLLFYYVLIIHPSQIYNPSVSRTILYLLLKYIIYLVPPLNFSLIIWKLTRIWTERKKYELHSIADQRRWSYLKFESNENPYAFLEDFLFLCADIVIYSLVLVIIENHSLSRWFIGFFKRHSNPRSVSVPETDRSVLMERDFVGKYFMAPDAQSNSDVALLVHSLEKQYYKIRKPPVTVLRNITFAVKYGQCFGIAGVNGAGKTTILKILVQDIEKTNGDAIISNYSLSNDRYYYLLKIGYCAQTNCFLEELTGREMLILIALLRGILWHDVENLVDKWMDISDLKRYENQECGTYSGGNKRKLCTLMSMIGNPEVILLDEPTTGVDPTARQKLYDMIRVHKEEGRVIILTSHRMNECELLCDRLTIIVAGEMKCIGSIQELNTQFTNGIVIKIKLREQSNASNISGMIKQSISEQFTKKYSVMFDEHKGYLYFQISSHAISLSKVFAIMENLKLQTNHLEEYIITNSSLEEVFLAFTDQSLDL